MVPRILSALVLAGAPLGAWAFTVAIAPASPQEVYLQVGVGGFTGNYNVGGTPGNNATVNKASVTVAAAAVGNGTAQVLSTDSSIGASPYDGYIFCNTPAQMYIGGFYRRTNSGSNTATVTATVPAALVNASGDQIAFSRLSWTTSGNGDTGGQPFPAGTFVSGGVQTVGTIAQNQWAESCWTFRYSNTTVPPQGTYTGRVLYTVTAP